MDSVAAEYQNAVRKLADQGKGSGFVTNQRELVLRQSKFGLLQKLRGL